jgi:hypothetical protein
MELTNRCVRFRIRDVHIPAPEDVLRQIYGDDILQGRVVGLSDSGAEEGAFAVIEVDGLGQWLIVPVARLLGVV